MQLKTSNATYEIATDSEADREFIEEDFEETYAETEVVESLARIEQYEMCQTSFMLFFFVVIILNYTYKFLKMFF